MEKGRAITKKGVPRPVERWKKEGEKLCKNYAKSGTEKSGNLTTCGR